MAKKDNYMAIKNLSGVKWKQTQREETNRQGCQYMKFNDRTAQIPRFWFEIVDRALKDRMEATHELWLGKSNYEKMKSGTTVSGYDMNKAIHLIYERFGEETTSIILDSANKIHHVKPYATLVSLMTCHTLKDFLTTLEKYAFAIHPLLKLYVDNNDEDGVKLWMVTQEHVDEFNLVSHLSLTLYLSIIIYLIKIFIDNDSTIKLYINEITVNSIIIEELAKRYHVEVNKGYPARYFHFTHEQLNAVSHMSNPSLHRSVSQLTEELFDTQVSESLAFRVQKFFEGQEVRDIDLNTTASHFNMSIRTLNRKLSKEGTLFSRLFDQFRIEQSIHLLGLGKMSITQVAYEIGFNEPSAFTRAFKRWTGKTPQQMVNQS